MATSVLHACGAAALFGARTPFAKLLVGELPPMLLAMYCISAEIY